MKTSETAIIFIEYQNAFCHKDGASYSAVESELARNNTIPNAMRLLEAARAKGCKIIHCPFTLDANWCREKQVDGILSGMADGNVMAAGSWGHEIIPELAPREGEVVLEGKRTLSAFSNTNLDSLLKFGKIKNFIVAGFLTNICVQATAWSAYDAGYHVRIVPDACCATSKDIHDYVVREVCLIVGGAMSVDDFITEVQ